MANGLWRYWVVATLLAACGGGTPGVEEPMPHRARRESGPAAREGRGAVADRDRVPGNGRAAPAAPAAGSGGPTRPGTASAPAARTIDVAERLTMWKSRLRAGFRVEAEKTVPGFGYAFARNANDDATAVLVSPGGETEGPFGRASDANVTLHVPANAMVDAGDLDGDGRGDLLITRVTEGGGSCAIYLDRTTGPLEAWTTDKPATCYAAARNGKPAVYVETAEKSQLNDDETDPAYHAIQWNGSAFALAKAASVPEARRPARASAPYSGRCAGNDDHVSDAKPGRSWWVAGKVRDGNLVSVGVIGNGVQCSGGTGAVSVPLGKEKTLPFTWRSTSFRPDTPPKEKRDTLKVRVRNGALYVRGKLCGEGTEQDTTVPCSWTGPDDIVRME